jgi:crotonobetainyl-CoA:carnitine CoA-transferase CaiB-like acyl-CoA transferase
VTREPAALAGLPPEEVPQAPLAGLRVIDLSTWAFCPAAASVLAGWGADVIHVENPASPDPMRLFPHGDLRPGGASWWFKHYNQGKRAVAVNLTSSAGREVLERLLASADVFITNLLPAAQRKLGLDVADVRAVNPALVYAKGSGAGALGPDAEKGGYDGASWWCRGGLAHTAMLVAGSGEPPRLIGHGDGISGLVFAGGIAAALAGRAQTGKAAVVDSSLFGTALWFNAPAVITSQFAAEDREFQAKPVHRTSHWSANMYRTADGRFLQLSLVGDKQADWADFCAHLGRPDLERDPRFADAQSRQRNSEALVAVLDDAFSSAGLAHWRSALGPMRGVWSPVQTAGEVHQDPQASANGYLGAVAYPNGPLTVVNPPVTFDERPNGARPAPDFGQHTDQILAELGYDELLVSRLRQAGDVV